MTNEQTPLPGGQEANPVPDNQTPVGTPASTANIFDTLIQKSQAEKAAGSDKSEEKILTGVIEKKENSRILGMMPEKRDLAMMKIMKSQKRLSIGWTVLKVAIFAAIVSFGYFYYELTPSFTYLDSVLSRANSVNTLTEHKTKLGQTQADINANNLIAAQMSIDRFVYLADLYFYYQDRISTLNRGKTDKSSIPVYEKELNTVRENLIKNLEFIQDRLKKNFYPTVTLDETAQSEFQNAISEQTKSKIRDIKKLEVKNPVGLTDPQTFDGAIKLFGNQQLMNSFKNLNLTALKKEIDNADEEKDEGKSDTENTFEETIEKLAADINKVAQNDLSIVAKIREQRMIWTDFMEIIENITKSVDKFYTNPKVRQVFYDSYRFDAKDGKIAVSGTTRKLDRLNFTLLANLIDSFEKSESFSDVDVSSLSKNTEGDYSTAPINLDFQIQKGDDPRDAIVSLKDYLADYEIETKDSEEEEKVAGEKKDSGESKEEAKKEQGAKEEAKNEPKS